MKNLVESFSDHAALYRAGKICNRCYHRQYGKKRRSTIKTAITIVIGCIWVLLSCELVAESQSLGVSDNSVSAGIYEITWSWSANVHDFNDDGWQDVLLVRHNKYPARLYRNDFGRFKEINVGTFSLKDRHDCTWGDVNQDGLPDVYCTLGPFLGTGSKKNELWIQQPNGTFVDKASSHGVTDPYGRGRFTTFINVNNDPYPDLFVGNEYPRQDNIPSVNRLFINKNGTSFRDAPEYGLNKEVGGNCAQAADFNKDGWEDLLVCGQSQRRPLLYRNNKGKSFTNVSASVGISSDGCEDAVLVDLNDDGRLDLAQVNHTQFQVRLWKNGVFQPPTAVRTLEYGTGVAAGDVNGDFLPDLYVVQGDGTLPSNPPDLMLINKDFGRTFVQTSIPQTTKGAGQHVAAIDYNNDGKVDFIVLNGEGGKKGPVQLISFD